MVLRLYSIFDRKAEEFGPVFQSKNDEVAIRAYRKHMQNVDALSKDDYELAYLGTFDTELGKLYDCELTLVDEGSMEVIQ